MEMEVDGGGPRRNRKNDGARNGGGLVRNTSSEPEERPISERWRARAKLVAGTGRTTDLGTVAGSWETSRRNRKNDGAGLRTVVDDGKILGRWREGGKIWGEVGEEKWENGMLFWFLFSNFEIS
jgi:hypothetical protein